MSKKVKFFLLLLNFFIMITMLWTAFDKANPLYIYSFAYPVQYVRASLEASDLKPHWDNKGDCRIQNTIAVIKNPNLYVVFGKIQDPKTGIGGDHQWATSNPKEPNVYRYIVDKTTGLTEEKKKRAYYMPQVVYKLDAGKCELIPIGQFKELTSEEEFLVKSGKFYVETFCKKYKEKWIKNNKK